MSVLSDYGAGDELRSSSSLRRSYSFRRSSTATVSSAAGSLHDEQQRRRSAFGTIEPFRKPSFVGLPLRLLRSRTKTLANVREGNAAFSEYATTACFGLSAHSISAVQASVTGSSPSRTRSSSTSSPTSPPPTPSPPASAPMPCLTFCHSTLPPSPVPFSTELYTATRTCTLKCFTHRPAHCPTFRICCRCCTVKLSSIRWSLRSPTSSNSKSTR
jgi:hypothetical protein